MEEFVGGMEA
jgi:hypothetical protein